MRALEHLMPVTGEAKITAEQAHVAHQHWIERIQKLWRRLHRHRNQEVVRIQNEIRKNKRSINELTRENLFELDVNHNDQMIFLNVSGKTRKLQKQVKYS